MIPLFIKRVIKMLPGIKGVFAECSQLRADLNQTRRELLQYRTWVPPGHYYSPIPSVADIRSENEKTRDPQGKALPGVDLHENEQLKLLNELRQYYAEIPFRAKKTESCRFYFDNPMFSYGDAILLYSMIRHLQPKRIIEAGSGYSSCVTLDTNEIFFDNRIACTFIEPYPDSLLSLIRKGDQENFQLVSQRLQTVRLELFSDLGPGNILFIDSTHVAKFASDVNYLFFEILPSIRAGVYIHFHDIFFPFEYPDEWLIEGRAWNEAYIMRAFLQYNDIFRIVLFPTFLARFHRDSYFAAMPLCAKNIGGCIWLKKEK